MRKVSRVYDGSRPVQALREVTLRVERGEFVAVTGPSGSGKSTLLHLMGLLDRPTSGRYEFDGNDVSRMREAERTRLRARAIGFVFQSFHLLSGRTAAENVALGEVYGGWRRSGRAERAAHALERVGMAHRAGFPVERLSGGEKQRVAIARALMGEPAVLLCDEPTGNLDTVSGTAIISLLRTLNQSGVTVLIITHDETISVQFERCVRLRDGQILPVAAVAAVATMATGATA